MRILQPAAYLFSVRGSLGGEALATAVVNQMFTFQIVASGQLANYSVSGLPPGFPGTPVV